MKMMAFLEFIWRYGVWVAVPAFFLALFMLGWCIWSMIRIERASQLARFPLAERQTVVFKEPGRAMLCVEGPLLTTRFGRLCYELLGENGVPVSGRGFLFRQTTSGITTVRRAERLFDFPRAGNYTLVVSGLGEPKAGDERHALSFKRPFLHWALLCILGIILSAGLTIGSLVLFLMKLVGVE
jgi:hypothetical protein